MRIQYQGHESRIFHKFLINTLNPSKLKTGYYFQSYLPF